jgi:hypothetical protein
VTNVDSQGSDQNIVIQVIGEISNKGQPHKKFCQTFVLAEQTNGYFVLNDIFRYIAEEPEEEEEQLQQDLTAPAHGVQEPIPTTTEEIDDLPLPAEVPETIAEVDDKLEDVIHQEETAREVSPPPAEVNGTPIPEEAEVVQAEDAPAAAVSATEETPALEVETALAEEVAEPEKPKDPVSTPVAPPASKPAKTAAAPVPIPAPKPAAPKTWAALVGSGNRVATPNIPSPAAAAAPSQPKATPSASAPTPPPAVAAQTAPAAREASPANGDAGWQTAGTSHKKEQSRSQNQAPVPENDGKRAYIKNVGNNVEEAALHAAMSKFGEVAYFDISRPKVRRQS